jgi:amidase
MSADFTKKDQFHVKSVDTTMGYVGWIDSNLGIKHLDQAHQMKSQITRELLSLGAVLFCETNLPQTLLFWETKNNIIGQTLIPHDENLSCGGSFGGEAALQALRGSTFGVGTNIGGFVHIPAAFSGIFIKPTPCEMLVTAPAGEESWQSRAQGFRGTGVE